MSKAQIFAGMALALALGACKSGGDDGPAGLCQAIAGGGSQFTTTPAPNATFSNAGAIFDGDLVSFGTLTTTGGAGTSSMQGTVQSGIVEPAGSVAGFLYIGSINNNATLNITTYLGGVTQDSGPPLFSIINTDSGYSFYGLHTTKPFDSIQVVLNLTSEPSLDLHEICVR